jgi:hypothetical protein
MCLTADIKRETKLCFFWSLTMWPSCNIDGRNMDQSRQVLATHVCSQTTIPTFTKGFPNIFDRTAVVA